MDVGEQPMTGTWSLLLLAAKFSPRAARLATESIVRFEESKLGSASEHLGPSGLGPPDEVTIVDLRLGDAM